jgi:hypothetical protein
VTWQSPHCGSPPTTPSLRGLRAGACDGAEPVNRNEMKVGSPPIVDPLNGGLLATLRSARSDVTTHRHLLQNTHKNTLSLLQIK